MIPTNAKTKIPTQLAPKSGRHNVFIVLIIPVYQTDAALVLVIGSLVSITTRQIQSHKSLASFIAINLKNITHMNRTWSPTFKLNIALKFLRFLCIAWMALVVANIDNINLTDITYLNITTLIYSNAFILPNILYLAGTSRLTTYLLFPLQQNCKLIFELRRLIPYLIPVITLL
jgi:hypothetical protein